MFGTTPVERHRDRTNEILDKYGNTPIGILRGMFGPYFAPACNPASKLCECLDNLDERSLTQLLSDVGRGVR
jgi:hypothetical protein